MKKTLLLGLGAVALAVGGAATVFGGRQAVEAKADNYDKYVSAALTPSANTMRYWFVNNVTAFYEGGAKMGIHAWKDEVVDEYYLMTVYQNGSGTGQYFNYVDIPLAAENIQIIRFANTASASAISTIWGDSGTFSVSSFQPYHLHGCLGDKGLGGLNNQVSGSGGNIEGPSAYLLGEVLRGYVTCSDSEYNGYGAASHLWSTWVNPHKTGGSTINGNWEEVTLNDYAEGSYSGNEDSYDDLPRGTSFTVKAKWEGLAKKASINPDTGAALSPANRVVAMGNSGNSEIGLIATAGAVGILATGAFAFWSIKRKKEQE